MVDAEGRHDGGPCPTCSSLNTISYHYREGHTELECPTCGYRSDQRELSDLQRYDGSLLEESDAPQVPLKPLKA